MRILITGGAGFIGSNLIHWLIHETQHSIINVDKLTYAANLESLQSVESNPRYHFEQIDITDAPAVKRLFEKYQPDAVMHLAAESHVDRSIDGPSQFIQTNVVGTFNLLNSAKNYWETLPSENKSRFRFHHVSTDEVFGSLADDERAFDEETPYDPHSPYSASKASSDHLVRAWYTTYGLPILITNCSNNYGPYQFPEKLIPVVILNAISGQPIPVYGSGENIRDWLYVTDHVRAMYAVLTRGRVGETYCIGGNNERTNLDVVNQMCRLLDRLYPIAENDNLTTDQKTELKSYADLITFVTDRPGHDLRYAIDASKIKRELGWQPVKDFETGLEKTVRWYLANRPWWTNILSGDYQLC